MTAKSKNGVKYGVLVLILANTIAAGAEWCSTALQNIADAFPDAPYSLITLVNNVPNICAVVFCLVAGLTVNRKIPLKGFMLFAMAFHVVGGILPAFIGNSIGTLLLGRFIFGIGYGIMQGLSISMVYKLVTNEKLRIHAMGWTQSAQYGINIVAQIIVGYLCVIRWNLSFLVYFWGIIPLIAVAVLCPKFELDKDDTELINAVGGTEARENVGETLKKLPAITWIYSVFMALYFMNEYVLIVNAAPLIIGRGYGDPISAGYAMTFFGVACFLGGLVFGALAKALKHYLHLFVCVILAIALIIVHFAGSYPMIVVALVFGGLGTWMIPATMSGYTPYVPAHRIYLSTAITMACVNAGAFLSTPYIRIFELQGKTSVDAFIPSAIILLIMGVISIFINKWAAKKYPVVNIDK